MDNRTLMEFIGTQERVVQLRNIISEAHSAYCANAKAATGKEKDYWMGKMDAASHIETQVECMFCELFRSEYPDFSEGGV
jgi:hypothetical protein